jgi:FixJ family two-component response regulator
MAVLTSTPLEELVSDIRMPGLNGLDLQRRSSSKPAFPTLPHALMTGGLSNKQISAKLGPAVKTVKIHRSRVMGKMEARSLAHLVRMAEKLKGLCSVLPPDKT